MPRTKVLRILQCDLLKLEEYLRKMVVPIVNQIKANGDISPEYITNFLMMHLQNDPETFKITGYIVEDK
jgi:hypothetical protein